MLINYGNVRGFHYAMCLNWRFNIEMLKGLMEWPVYISKDGEFFSIESYVQVYVEDDIWGTTSVLVVDKNLAYVISFGTQNSGSLSDRRGLLLVSRITNGEASHIFNHVVERV
jgi:hypothetical protein